MNNLYTRTTKPDKKCYYPSRPASEYKVGETYDVLLWNRNNLERVNGRISDDQIPSSFYILEGIVTKVDQHLHLKFAKGIGNSIETLYTINGGKKDDEIYFDTWKKLVDITKKGPKTKQTGVTEDTNSVSKGVTEDNGRTTGRGVTEDIPIKGTGTGVTEDMPTGVTEDI
ncbi:MAG: hypothetical protein ABGX20_11095 [Bacillus sp. (in: firmicutes)]